MNSNGATVSVNLDGATLHALDALARRWGVSREEAMQRAVAQAAPPEETLPSAKISALRALQRNLALTPGRASAWQAAVQDARR